MLVTRQPGDAPRDLTAGIKIGAGVGYSGGDFTVRGGTVVFSSGGRLYTLPVEGGAPRAVTPAFGDCASPAISPDGSKILFVHSYERADCLALVDAQGNNYPVKLAHGAYFYMQPVWHPNGQHICWIEWNHPQMPWDGTRLMIARLGRELGVGIRQFRQGLEAPAEPDTDKLPDRDEPGAYPRES